MMMLPTAEIRSWRQSIIRGGILMAYAVLVATAFGITILAWNKVELECPPCEHWKTTHVTESEYEQYEMFDVDSDADKDVVKLDRGFWIENPSMGLSSQASCSSNSWCVHPMTLMGRCYLHARMYAESRGIALSEAILYMECWKL